MVRHHFHTATAALFSVASLFFLLFLGAVSCIKEDRTDCPSYLTVNMDRFIEAGFREVVVSYLTDGCTVQQERINLDDYALGGYELPVRRGVRARASVVAGLSASTVTSTAVLSRSNTPFDPVWAFAGEVTPEGDLESVEARPHKQHCRLRLVCNGREENTAVKGEGAEKKEDGYSSAEALFPYALRARASFWGIGLFDLEPQQTDYEMVVHPDGSSVYTVILPRQGDNDILLDIILPGDNEQTSGELIYFIDLGKRLIAAGYDWHKQDLDDIDVFVDFSRAQVSIDVKPWDENHQYDNYEF